MKSWSEEINKKIDSKLEGVNDKDFRFFRIAEFKRNISRIDSFANSCKHCKHEQPHIQDVVESIDQAVNNLGRKRKEYDKLISRMAKHMQNSHGFYTPYYFTYYYSFFGILAGAICGYLLMSLNPDFRLELFCSGIAIGLLPTYITGYIKDKKIRSQKKLM